VPDHQPAGVALDVVNEHFRDVGGGGRTTLLTDDRWDAGEADGRAIVVAYQDDYSGLPFDRDAPTNTEVGDLPATSGHTGNIAWVTWLFCPGDGCDHQNHAAVIGVNVNANDVLDIANHATVERETTVVRALPDGMHERATEPFSFGALDDWTGVWAKPAATLRWRARHASLQISMVDDSSTLRGFLRFSVDDADGSEMRGHRGLAGYGLTFAGAPERTTRLWTWDEGGKTILVQAAGMTAEEVQRTIDSLRPATASDWERLRMDATEPRPEYFTGDGTTVSGTFDGGAWYLTFERNPRGGVDYSDLIRFVDGDSSGGAASGTTVEHPDLAFVTSKAGTLFWALAPAPVDRMEIEFADGRRLTPTLRPIGPGFTERVFGEFVPGYPNVTSARAFHGAEPLFEVRDFGRMQPNPQLSAGWSFEPVAP
jgi:hypothetical protein